MFFSSFLFFKEFYLKQFSSKQVNACKCPLHLSRITAVILGFSGVKGTNPQILPPNVYDEQPRLLAFGKRKWGKRVNPCAHDNYLRSIISSTHLLRRPMFFCYSPDRRINITRLFSQPLSSLIDASQDHFPVGGYYCQIFPCRNLLTSRRTWYQLRRSFFFLKITWRHSNNQ